MTASKEGLWSESCHVYTHDSDMSGTMTLTAIARYFQEAAWHSAESLGFGYERASELNQYWVLVRQCIRMDRFPRWGEDLTIETWPRGVEGLWAFRDYYIRDREGLICGGATSSWMIMDGKTHRPQKPEIVSAAMPYVINVAALGKSAPKVQCEGPGEVADSRLVRFSDMDVHGHLNNSKYVEWIMDAVHMLGRNVKPMEFSINFLAEAREMETIEILSSVTPHTAIVKGERKDDGRLVFIAELLP